MARVCAFLVVVALFGAAGGVPAGGAAEPALPEVKIGLPQPMFKDVPQALVNAAARPFQSMIQKTAGLNGQLEIVPDYKQLADRIKAGKIDIAVFHGFEYAWVKDTPGIVPLVTTLPNCGKVQACLVVNANSMAKEPKDLKGACVLVPKGSKAHCQMFLERIRDSIPAGDCCPAKPEGLTPEEVLGEVAGGTADAALVDISALVALEKNLPGCYARLKVLSKSELLPPAVVVYRKGALDAKTVGRVRDGLLDCAGTPAGKTFLLFWQLKGFENLSPRYNDHVEACLKAYPAPVEKPATPQVMNQK